MNYIIMRPGNNSLRVRLLKRLLISSLKSKHPKVIDHLCFSLNCTIKPFTVNYTYTHVITSVHIHCKYKTRSGRLKMVGYFPPLIPSEMAKSVWHSLYKKWTYRRTEYEQVN